MTLKVAVIGAGPAGLVVPRWLLSQGFEPLIFGRVRHSAVNGPHCPAEAACGRAYIPTPAES
jgi:flavin-dependent dehydrogenase